MAKSKKPAPESEAERLARRLAEHIDEWRVSFARRGNPMPTVKFEVGEEVCVGSLDKVTVLEIFDEGRILKAHVFSLNGPNSQKPGQVHFDEDRIMPWHDLEKMSAASDDFSYTDNMHLNFQHRDIFGLLNTYYHFGINMNPDYQRDLVWTLDDKVSLIDSMFNHIDIGKFVLIPLPFKKDDNGYEILDGKQRLSAIVDFYEGRFKYRGRTYHELSYKDRNFFTSRSISWAETQRELTDEMKYRYFLKLNTTGRPQDPKHIMHVRSLYNKVRTTPA